MTEQIRTQPPVFEVQKHFGPFMATVELPEDTGHLRTAVNVLKERVEELRKSAKYYGLDNG